MAQLPDTLNDNMEEVTTEEQQIPMAAPAMANRDRLVELGLLSPELANKMGGEQPEAELPATLENQEATKRAIDFDEKIEAKKNLQKRYAGKELTQQEAQSAVLNDVKQEKEQEAINKVEADQEQLMQEQELAAQQQQALINYAEQKQLAQSEGLPFEEDPQLEEAIQNQQAAQQDNLQAQEADQFTQNAIDQDSADIQQQKQATKEHLKSQIAQEEAVREVEAGEQEKQIRQVDELQKQIEKEEQELANMSIEQVSGSPTLGQSLLGILAAALGGYASHATGGKNLALEQMNKRVDRDLDAQKFHHTKRIAAKKRIMDLMKMKLTRQYKQTDNELKKAKIAQIYTGIDQKRQELGEQHVAQLQRSQLLKKSRIQPLNQDEESTLIESLSSKDRKRYIPGFGLAKDPEVAKKVSAQLDSGDQALESVAKIRGLLDSHGSFEVMDRGAVATEESTRRALQIQLKEMFNLGVIKGPDLVLLEEFTGGDFFSPLALESSKRAKLRSVEDYIKSRVNSSLKTAGLPITGKSKLDNWIEFSKKKGLSEQQAVQAWSKMLEKGGK